MLEFDATHLVGNPTCLIFLLHAREKYETVHLKLDTGATYTLFVKLNYSSIGTPDYTLFIL